MCGYKEARGDQCDNCGSWYEAYELIEPHSKVTGGPAEVRETTHLYLDLPKFSERLREYVVSQEHWRTSVKNFILGIIDGGLEKRPITRDIQWGVPVPEPGFEEKRFYVWFDACIGYVSSTMEWAENIGEPDRWREYWQDPETRLIHFIGKDNTVFHTLIWPAQLMGTAEDGEEPFVLPYDVPANEFMNLEVVIRRRAAPDADVHEPQPRGVAARGPRPLPGRPFALLPGLEFAGDGGRGLLLARVPEQGELGPDRQPRQLHKSRPLLRGEVLRRRDPTPRRAARRRPRRPRRLQGTGGALRVNGCSPPGPARRWESSWRWARRANRFFDASAPWKTRKEDPEQTRVTLYVCSVLLGSIAYHAAPYVPEAIERLEGFFDGPIARVSDLDGLPKGYRVTGAKPLFRRIEDDEVAAAEGQLSRAVSGEALSGQLSACLVSKKLAADSSKAYALRFSVDTVYVPSGSSPSS